ncbi:FadR/GntR family transcriptional regulator [Gordonia hankookensis]|uniref:FadR family transcriptional regulator n=1 Tax=Gordonia hankookensis TaxID=589403 RepID=A0ABR7W9X5_9ACTN|nr:FCD domain-containing protein [Gordonia hankookensis]MBD1319614.1 FadR family transcriptional regulator [Gordonia hankookensis]
MQSDRDRVRDSLAVDGAVRAPKAAEQIAGRLRGRIVRGELAPGSKLKPERELLVEFGVSRPTLREAFRILESEGLIVVVTGAGGGPRVQVPDLGVVSRQIGYYLQIKQTTLKDLLEARQEFEPICVRLLAERRTRGALRELDALLDDLRQVADTGFATDSAYAAWVDMTREFHESIADHCGNNTLAVQARALGEMLRAHHRRSLRSVNFRPSTPQLASELIGDYSKLLDLVRARDGAEAERHWRAHLQRSARLTYRNQDPRSLVDLVD